MLIQEACDLLKRELLNNGYKYGFYLDGKIYTPRLENGFDKDFFHRLLTDYRIQEPSDTMKAKVGTCNDIVALMRAMLYSQLKTFSKKNNLILSY